MEQDNTQQMQQEGQQTAVNNGLQSQGVNGVPNKRNNKLIMLIAVAIVLIAAMGAYIILSTNQLNYGLNVSTDNSSTVLPTNEPFQTDNNANLSPEEEALSVDNPETDLMEIEKDLNSL